MFEIRRSFTLSSAHFMPDDDGPCGRVHGHNFLVTVCFRSLDINDQGMVVNALSLEPMIETAKNRYDHRSLNDRFLFPTIENLALAVAEVFRGCAWVEVDEGLGISCRYEPEATT